MFDLDRYLRESFSVVKESGDERILTCLYCGGRDKLYLNVVKRRFNCFKCGAGRGANLVDFIRDHRHVSIAEALEIIKTERWQQYEPVTYASRFENQIRHRPRSHALPDEYQPLYPVEDLDDTVLGQRAITYLRARGLTDGDILEYHIGFCLSGKYARRIIVPVFRNKVPVYFVARLFFGSGKKYLNPANDEVLERASNLLFNWDVAKRQPVLQLCEGVFDGMGLGDPAAARFGKVLHVGQLYLLEDGQFGDVEVWIDPDAKAAATRIANQLRDFGKPVSICELSSGDPGELLRRQIPVKRYERVGWAAYFRRQTSLNQGHHDDSSRTIVGRTGTSL